MFKKISVIFVSLLVAFVFMGFAVLHPSNLGKNVNPNGSFYVTPSQSKYVFSLSSQTQSSIIALRVTPLNGDPEIKEWCYNSSSCSMDLSSYNFDTSSDYIIFAHADNGGYFIFEEQ